MSEFRKVSKPILAIVVPCYNEEEIVEYSSNELLKILKECIISNRISEDSYICFVDDGSKDSTYSLLQKLCLEEKSFKVIKLLYNSGHQNALYCGLTENEADIYITIDCDLQDDINIIPQMVDEYLEKSLDVVFGVRNSREKDSFGKRFFAELYYKILPLFGIRNIPNHADYRLITKNVVLFLKEIKSQNIYLRGLIVNQNFNSSIIYYERKERCGGEAKYTFLKSFQLAMSGILSQTTFPIKFILILSVLLFILSILLKSLILFVGSLNFLALWIIGEYLTKYSFETKKRPNYIVTARINH